MVIAVFCRGYCWALRVNCLVALVVKNIPANARDIRDVGLSLDSGRSPGEGSSLQYSYLEKSMDRGANSGLLSQRVGVK